MKYMGSKRSMLQNGLGEIICRESHKAKRVVDLFCGAGYISWYAAENTKCPVLGNDLQTFAVVLANAVITRTVPIDASQLENDWIENALSLRAKSSIWIDTQKIESQAPSIQHFVDAARLICSEIPSNGPTWNAYGGHYFSPAQSLTLDLLISCLPTTEPDRSICLSATLHAASRCAAAPGHTAQPFQATPNAAAHLSDAWRRDPVAYCRTALATICPRHANAPGSAFVGDAVEVARTLHSGDLAIIDPPYSNVQYSRFYHVLETISRGSSEKTSGIGRYPSIATRPQSDFSKKGSSRSAMSQLMVALAHVSAKAVVTFPVGESSNGLSGDMLTEIIQPYFKISEQVVVGKFSTLGGNNYRRAARKDSRELILVLSPR